MITSAVFEDRCFERVPVTANRGFLRHLALTQTSRNGDGNQQRNQKRDGRRGEQSVTRVLHTAETLRLQTDRAVNLLAKPKRREHDRNRDPLHAPGRSFSGSDPGPEREPTSPALDHRDDCLHEEDENVQSSADGEQQRSPVGWQFMRGPGKWLPDGAGAALFTTAAQCSMKLEAAARTNSQGSTSLYFRLPIADCRFTGPTLLTVSIGNRESAIGNGSPRFSSRHV